MSLERARNIPGRKKFTHAQVNRLFGLAITLPAIVVLFTTVFLPVLKGIYVSFCAYKLKNLDAPVWNSFANYIKLFCKGDIFTYFSTTVVYVVFTVIIQFVLGLLIALLLNSNIRGRNFFRGLYLIPWTIPSIVVAIVWRWMLHQQFGVVNYLLYTLGITDTVNLSWTMNAGRAMASIIIASAWRQLPYMMVMLLAGLQSVDASLEEAAKIDGANALQTLACVKLPSMMPVIISALWIAVMSNFQMYTIISTMTGGGPVNATTTLSLAAYKAAFQSYDFGQAAAMGVLWLIVLFAITLLTNRMSARYSADI